MDPSRDRWLRIALALGCATVAWNVAEGVIAVAAGAAADSIALFGFGVDSFIETASGAIVVWRVWGEMRSRSGARAEAIERRAAKAAGGLLLALAGWLLFDSGRRLLGYGESARESRAGMILTAISMALMPLLGWAKLRSARALSSRALRADAFETITCAWLSLTTLGGLALNMAFGWPWADPLAGLALVPLIAREGLEGWRGGCECEEDERVA